ncbi:unnamed protein product [Bursaphelenchus okinawaensis]|uniref:WW domain-containing protein n=1 Tax=Bursaphelenchus okinawaensis TaxID=465554 RepID=A0A811JTL6_9BILA|nr:unnamed protein product [Bursaphelenchus okinawaensis]CAG9083196.1 unnamed protein product [Bursaphelenchus okinawaensis]
MKSSARDRPSGKIREVGPWSEQTSSSGKRYYYNHETEVSQWEKPAVWREHEKKLSEEKERQKHHDSEKPSTSSHHHSSKDTHHSSPYNRNGTSIIRSKDRASSFSKDAPPAKKLKEADHKENHEQNSSHHNATFDAPLIPQAPLPPLLSIDTSTSRIDEPMDVANSPPPESKTSKSFINIPLPTVRPFDDTKYNLFYKPSSVSSLRKSLGNESTLNEVKKNQEKLQKSQLGLMELETSIISIQSLLFTAEAKCALLSDKFNFIDSQVDAIRNVQHRVDTDNGPISPKAERLHQPAAEIKVEELNGNNNMESKL